MSESGDGVPGDDVPGDPASDAAREEVDPFDDGTLEVPTCARCLHRMEPVEAASGGVRWGCERCGAAAIA